MDRGIWAAAAVLAMTLGILAVPARAAPAIGAGAGGVKAALSRTPAVDEVRWYRRCWRTRRGVRTCRRVWVGPSYGYGPGFYYGPRRPFREPHYRHYRERHYRGDGGMRY